MSTIGTEARRFVRRQSNGVLSTLSQRMAGYPFGSVAPFVPDQQGRPVILISALAEHTRNIEADPRVSLIVQPFTPEMQEAGRVTLVGRAERLVDKEMFGPRYLRHLPQAETYFAMQDFQFYRIEPERIRFIGGFGRVHWVEAAAYLAPTTALAEQETDLLAHINTEHAQDLRDCCQHLHDVEVQTVTMVGLDGDGFDVRADGHLLRFDWPHFIHDATEALAALADLVRECRA